MGLRNRDKSKQALYAKEYREKNREKMRLSQQSYEERCKENGRANQNLKRKLSALDSYGGRICNCCGETEVMFLTIDHINNGGAEHRREIGRGRLYHWLKNNGYPPGFQVLCWNCNRGKWMNGGICPHKLRPKP